MATLAALAAALSPATALADERPVKAGVAALDASWHVGAGTGQYASNGTVAGDHGVDPTTHSTKRVPSYGVQSRLDVRALVVQGPDGERVAVVKNDLYIPQDLLYRRTAQILEDNGTSGITRENLTIAVSHNHSSPYYSSISWGLWVYQDVFDVRFYDYYAKRMAAVVEKAAARLVPVRVGASVNQFDKTHQHSFGGAIADDGTPAGYPVDDADHDMTVVRFDDISKPGRPKPLANLVNFGLHPEFLSGNNLITGDYIAPLQRMVDDETGAMTIFTQNAVGTAEPENSAYHSVHERLEFGHREYAQAEYGGRLMADSIVDAWRDIERGTPADPVRFVPFRKSFPVAMEDRWFPGPLSHPYPGLSSCRTDEALKGNAGVPVVGLPDCGRPMEYFGLPDLPFDPGLSSEDFRRAGIPVPENYGVPIYGGLEEDVNVHLQAFRLGDILFTVCSCEQWKDQSFNIKTRTDRTAGNEYLGYDWYQRCRQDGNGTYGDGPEGYGTGTWTCPDPTSGGSLKGLKDQSVQRMHAQVVNPANGWNDPDYVAWAESEPANLRQIKGNFTHDDDERSAQLGYRLTVTIAMANDYNGYIASYREYQRGDHYRKALTGWGPHSSDYLATRLVNMGRHLNGGPALPREPLEEKVAPDLAHNDARARTIGAMAERLVGAYEATLPDDGGPPSGLTEPRDIERFDTAFFTWTGGSNYTDNPRVAVERRSGGRWAGFARQSGEVPVTVAYPQAGEMAAYRAGRHRWRWTAHFEAFASAFDTLEGMRATPPGRYRFVVTGLSRDDGKPRPYRVVSRPFEVHPWSGITVDDLRVDSDGTVSFKVGPRRAISVERTDPSQPPVTAEIGPIDYPDSYTSPARFIVNRRTYVRDPGAPDDPSRFEWYCFTCTFRPWVDTGDARSARVTVLRADGTAETVPATERGGRWVTERQLAPGESAHVAVGGVRDAYGNLNGRASGRVEA